MNEYTVTWTVELSAENPEEAAKKALEMQRDPDSLALVFEVRPTKDSVVQIDLMPNDED